MKIGPNIFFTAIDITSDRDALRKAIFTELLSWTEEEGVSKIVGGEVNRLVYITIVHSFVPLYLISFFSPLTIECYTSDYELDHYPHRSNHESFLHEDGSS